jgi:hypothetical protein
VAVGGVAGVGERAHQILFLRFAGNLYPPPVGAFGEVSLEDWQDYQQLKEKLGLDHYEVRNWMGWHHHTTLVMMAHAFLTLETLRNCCKYCTHSPKKAHTRPQTPNGCSHVVFRRRAW